MQLARVVTNSLSFFLDTTRLGVGNATTFLMPVLCILVVVDLAIDLLGMSNPEAAFVASLFFFAIGCLIKLIWILTHAPADE